MECPEFRELLLYACPEIDDSELAKHDKIHSMIVDASVEYMAVLKKQLAVCFSSLKAALSIFTEIYLVFHGKNKLYGGYVVKEGSPAVLRYHRSLDTSNEIR